MLKMVNGTGIIGVDMICPLGISTPQPPNYDRVELEGTGMLALPNSLDAPLERLELGGKTEQVQTTGAQLFDIAKCPLEHNGISFKIPKSSGDVVLMDGYVFEENTQYTISAQKTTSKNENSAVFKFEYVDGSRNEIKVKDIAEKSLTSMSGKTVKRFLVVNPFGAVDEVFNFQLEKGTTATPYEPYTGGKPSPSPEYTQEIKNVGKWNEGTQKYEVDVKVVGKNLFDVNYFSKNENYQNKDGEANWKFAKLKVKPNTVYTVSKSKNTGVNGGINKSLTYVGALSFNNDINTAKITSDDTGVLYVMFLYRNQDVNILKEMDIQVELGDGFTEYEPYKKQTLTLTSDRPITKWDRLVEQGGQIGWLYASKKYVITGNEIFEYRSGYDQDAYTNRFIVINDLFVNRLSDKQLAYCKILKRVQYIYAQNKLEEGIDTNVNQLHIKLSNDRIGVLSSDDTETRTAKIAEYIKNTYTDGIEILYATTDTVFLPLPQSEQNAIRALKTYYPTTVITADGGELDPDIKVTYTADTKNYIDNKVSAKVASIIRQYRLNTANLLSLMPMETQATMIENDTNNILNNLESEETHE